MAFSTLTQTITIPDASKTTALQAIIRRMEQDKKMGGDTARTADLK